MKEAEYPLIILAMEEIIEIRLKGAPPAKSKTSKNAGKKK